MLRYMRTTGMSILPMLVFQYRTMRQMTACILCSSHSLRATGATPWMWVSDLFRGRLFTTFRQPCMVDHSLDITVRRLSIHARCSVGWVFTGESSVSHVNVKCQCKMRCSIDCRKHRGIFLCIQCGRTCFPLTCPISC